MYDTRVTLVTNIVKNNILQAMKSNRAAEWKDAYATREKRTSLRSSGRATKGIAMT
jgi:hypothetical protein